ncbi:serine hydrolase domain-containing protein [Pelagicoccus sp. SDUM812002]|uniref:serine hydrolase domain-containing protein n=1 Tax=Pelagicoccus sp. SDUM812002 TaxID=3041266 RepID=UPI0028107589|nr:serine hydrolase domain-containing protein [Pelagicoccus sp. SDUM812002]MDQ8184154.1 serine hydrolase [Pelagicoccus sp. SDUM812002]
MSKAKFSLPLATLILAAFAISGPVSVEGQATRLVDATRVDNALANLVNEHGLIGVSGLVYEKGEEVYFGAHGFAEREANRPMRRDTLAYIYSMTKPITGVALMTLYDRGKFKLDDPLSKYAPEFSNLKVYSGNDDKGDPIYEKPKRPITIRDVTRHTAGFSRGESPDGPITQAYLAEDPRNFNNTLTEMAEKLGRVPLACHPGERWLYGDSVDLQAFLVERISGQPFDEYLKANIFKPLGMQETAYYFGPEHDNRRTRIYVKQDDGSFEVEDMERIEFNQEPRALTPGGYGLISTLDDYMRFARMLLNEGELEGTRILQPDTVRLMATNALPATLTDSIWLPSKGQVGFGIDFAVRIASPATPEESSGEIGEFFWDGRASTLFWVDPVNDIAAVLFAQFMPFGAVPAHKDFRDAIYFDDASAAAPKDDR